MSDLLLAIALTGPDIAELGWDAILTSGLIWAGTQIVSLIAKNNEMMNFISVSMPKGSGYLKTFTGTLDAISDGVTPDEVEAGVKLLQAKIAKLRQN